jgi:hypothetical protein
MEAIRKLVPTLGRSASTILEDDVKEILVASSKHLDRLRDFTRDAALEGRYAEYVSEAILLALVPPLTVLSVRLGTRYETLKASPNPSTDEVKELRGDLKKFRDEVSLRKVDIPPVQRHSLMTFPPFQNEAVVASLG